MTLLHKGKPISQLGASLYAIYNINFDCSSFPQVIAAVLVGMMQCSGGVWNDNDILQEKFQLGSDNHFYRIKS